MSNDKLPQRIEQHLSYLHDTVSMWTTIILWCAILYGVFIALPNFVFGGKSVSTVMRSCQFEYLKTSESHVSKPYYIYMCMRAAGYDLDTDLQISKDTVCQSKEGAEVTRCYYFGIADMFWNRGVASLFKKAEPTLDRIQENIERRKKELQ